MEAFALGTGQAAQAIIIPLLRIAVFIDEVAAAQAALEADELGLVSEVQAARLERQAPVQGQLGQALVGVMSATVARS